MPTLNVNGHRLHYLETGGGDPTLVLAHGAGGGTGTWMRQLEGLADAATVVALDLPGHGGSRGDGRRTVADYATVVRGFLTGLGRGRVVLGGHSMGGAITQTVALTAPELLRGLVLVGTGARLRVLPEILELVETDYPAGVDFIIERAWSPSVPAALKQGGRLALRQTRAAVTLGDFTACDAFDAMTRIREIALPTLVIVGEDDCLTPPKYSEFLAREIPGARLVRIDHAGHYAPLEQPDAVNDAIRAFLATLHPCVWTPTHDGFRTLSSPRALGRDPTPTATRREDRAAAPRGRRARRSVPGPAGGGPTRSARRRGGAAGPR